MLYLILYNAIGYHLTTKRTKKEKKKKEKQFKKQN